MKPVQKDLFAVEGDTNVYTIQYLTDEGKPIDLTDMTISMCAKRDYSDDHPCFEFTVQQAYPKIGMFIASLSPDQTAGKVSKQFHTFYYDCQAVYNNIVNTFLYGQITVAPQVTS